MARDLAIQQRPDPPLRITASPEVPFLSPTLSAPVARRHPTDHAFPSPEVPCSVSTEFQSQDTDTRKRSRVADWVNSFKAAQDSVNRASQVSSSATSTPPRPGVATRASMLTPEEEDYDTWETGAASLQEIMELQRELVGKWAFLKSKVAILCTLIDIFVPETDEEELETGTEHGSSTTRRVSTT